MDALRFGRHYRALRIRLDRRQSDVAHDSGLSRSLIASIDRGELDGVSVGSLVRAAAALGADVDIRLRWRGEQLDRLVDEAHAGLVDSFLARLRRCGWIADVEVSFSVWGERGSVDILAFPATLHGLDRKARLARDIVGDRDWAIRTVSRLLVVGATATSRRRVARLESTYGAALPARGAIVRRWLEQPTSHLAGLLFVAFDSHDGARRRSAARERVRRRKPAQTTATTAVEPHRGATCQHAVRTAAVAVE